MGFTAIQLSSLTPYLKNPILDVAADPTGLALLDQALSCPRVKNIFDALVAKVSKKPNGTIQFSFVQNPLNFETKETTQISGLSKEIFPGKYAIYFVLNNSPEHPNAVMLYDFLSQLTLALDDEGDRLRLGMQQGQVGLEEYETGLVVSYYDKLKRIANIFKKCYPQWKEQLPMPTIAPSLAKYFIEEQLSGQLDAYRKQWVLEAQEKFCKPSNIKQFPLPCSLKAAEMFTKFDMSSNPEIAMKENFQKIFDHGNQWLARFKSGQLKYPEPLNSELAPLKMMNNFHQVLEWHNTHKK